MEFIKLFVTAFLSAFTLDILWLGFVAKSLYDDNIGMLLRKSGNSLAPIWSGAALVYVAIVMGVIIFVVPKANGSVLHALLWGALFGAILYGVYDFTNYAVLSNWTLKISIIDCLWGTFLCGVTSAVTVFVQGWLKS